MEKLRRTLTEIEEEMKGLYSKKELAYMDYLDNSGDSSWLRERLYREFDQHRENWNALVIERKEVLAKT